MSNSFDYQESNRFLHLNCDFHEGEEIERVCSVLNCKKDPLLCWQCSLDYQDHCKTHRQSILKFEDFLIKLEKDYINLQQEKQKAKEKVPKEILNIFDNEDNFTGILSF